MLGAFSASDIKNVNIGSWYKITLYAKKGVNASKVKAINKAILFADSKYFLSIKKSAIGSINTLSYFDTNAKARKIPAIGFLSFTKEIKNMIKEYIGNSEPFFIA